MIDVGKIVAPHGIGGEVKVLPLTTNPRRFQKGSTMWLAKTEQWVKIQRVRPQKDVLIVAFGEMDNRNDAEAVKGSLLQIEEAAVAPLPEGSFYFFQMDGAEVLEENGRHLGTLTDMIESGANDVYRVDLETPGDYLLLPAIKQVVKKVDIEAKIITVALLPGLMEACLNHED